MQKNPISASRNTSRNSKRTSAIRISPVSKLNEIASSRRSNLSSTSARNVSGLKTNMEKLKTNNQKEGSTQKEKEGSLSKVRSTSSLLKNKQNIYQNNGQKKETENKKYRTVRDVRLQNTQRQELAKQESNKLRDKSVNRRNQDKPAIKIQIHPPKLEISTQENQQTMKPERKDIIRHSQQENSEIAKYIPPLMSKRHSIADFTILRTISEATYFRQVLAIHKTLNALFTLRIIEKDEAASQEREQQLVQSLKIQTCLNQFSLPHLQTLYAIFDDPCSIYMVMEPLYIPCLQSLRQLAEMKNGLPQGEIHYYAGSILETLKQLHTNNIMLRNFDLNFFRVHFGVIKIGLLDGAVYCASRKRRNSFLGRPEQIPHQLALAQSYNFGYDMWNLGLIIYFFITTLKPFFGVNALISIQNLQFDMPMNISKELGDLLSRLLSQSQSRLSAIQALQHPFFRKKTIQKVLIPRDLWIFWQSP